MAVKALQFKTISMLQGGADAFVQGQLSTLINPSDGVGWMVKKIEMAFSTALAAVSADFNVKYALSRLTKAAMPDYSADDVILADGFSGSLTTSGQIVLPQLISYDVPDGVLVVGDTLYAQLDSDATALTIQAYMRIWYEEVRVTELEILRMIEQDAFSGGAGVVRIVP